jgi:hypothetical protein
MISFMLSFLVFIVVLAIIVIGVRWLLSLTDLVIPPPLLYILGLILFLVLLFVFLNYAGTGLNMGGAWFHH